MLGLIRNEGSLRVWYDGGRLINHSVAGARAVWLNYSSLGGEGFS